MKRQDISMVSPLNASLWKQARNDEGRDKSC
jgi:hypothetical protein